MIMAGELFFLALYVVNASGAFVNVFREHSSICRKSCQVWVFIFQRDHVLVFFHNGYFYCTRWL